VTACDALRPELRDIALGATPREGLRLHLATCATCAATLAEARRVLNRIDASMRERSGAEPLARLTERLLARIERAPVPRAFLGWGRIAVSAALVAGIAIATGSFRDRATTSAPSLMSWRSPTRALLHAHESVIDTPLDLDAGAPPRTRS